MGSDTDRVAPVGTRVGTRGRVVRAGMSSAHRARAPLRGHLDPGAPTADATACPRAGGTVVPSAPRTVDRCIAGRRAAVVAECGPAVMDGARFRAETAPAA